ncbi:MAG: hypothetical protein PSV18_15930 [Methylobacter sp.]|uniref:Uncharacterized protein n=1 Tax=Candidatus Methylobacter titanis TaxID=3053457 RepID=A0AA43Q645_9GAMM|nr:hypothetical protein [Candidatus Methylobacter titanis]MDI1294207.1 hypothetical protein [Candidatus Methylobacter titanis]
MQSDKRTNADINKFELIQGDADLYFDNALGHNRPLSILADRQASELLARPLVGSNQLH